LRAIFDAAAARAHNPAMNAPPRIFDSALHARRRQRALATADDDADFLFRAVAEDVTDRLSAVKRQFAIGLEIAPAAFLAATGQVDRVIRMDRIAGTKPDFAADVEALPLAPESVDLIASVLTLHWANDLPGALAQIRRALKPDGLFLAAFLGGETLTELRQSFAAAESELTGGASPRVGPFAELRAAGALLQRAGFALPVIDQDRRIVRYGSALHLMRDLRAMGATSTLTERARKPLRRDVLARVNEIYAERFADADGRVRATFDVISLSGWAPHESQQQPLRPGSAKARLAGALGAIERPAGEKSRP
jgi:SAM-dependent methyltransferase